jgi:hypothetical protein
MGVREQIIKNIAKIETDYDYMYCGKERKSDRTYYVFIDGECLPHYYSPESIKYYHIRNFSF